METVDCNLCGSADSTVAYRKPDALYNPDEWFSVVRCRACGLGFVNPRPTRSEIGRYYPSTFYDAFAEEEARAYNLTRYGREASFVERRAGSGNGRRLLDIGCANGDFPRFMARRGWTVEGVEVSQNSRPIEDFPVYRDIGAIPTSPGGRYDAVTAWAVIEHVHDPMSYFEKVREVLKPGGVFAFLVTNFESLASSRLFGEDVPRHLYFFTDTTVRRYLTANGMALLDADYSDRIYPMLPIGWLRYQIHRLLGRPFDWNDASLTHDRYLRERKLERTALNLARFALTHPLSVVDRLSAPLRARYEMLTRAYGIVTYVARRTD